MTVAYGQAYAGIEDVPRGGYGFAMIDPPWHFKNFSQKGEKKNAVKHYRCAPLDEIKALPIRDILSADAIVWLWALNPMLDVAVDALRAWGIEFKTSGCWKKVSRNGKMMWGSGYILRGCGEPFLIGTVGKPKFLARNVPSVIVGERREHSRKPVEAYAHAERMVGDVKKIEVFATQLRRGWDVMGDEVGKYRPDDQLEERSAEAR